LILQNNKNKKRYLFINDKELLLMKNYRPISLRNKGVIQKLLGWLGG
jgi:hypothetical protein